MKDLAGREATPVERKIVRLYDGVAELLREEGLAPCVAANLKEAAAALYVAMMDLGLRFERPDELGL